MKQLRHPIDGSAADREMTNTNPQGRSRRRSRAQITALVFGCCCLQPLLAASSFADDADQNRMPPEAIALVNSMENASREIGSMENASMENASMQNASMENGADDTGPARMLVASRADTSANLVTPASETPIAGNAAGADAMSDRVRSMSETGLMMLLVAVLLIVAGLNGRKRPLRPARSAPQ